MTMTPLLIVGLLVTAPPVTERPASENLQLAVHSIRPLLGPDAFRADPPNRLKLDFRPEGAALSNLGVTTESGDGATLQPNGAANSPPFHRPQDRRSGRRRIRRFLSRWLRRRGNRGRSLQLRRSGLEGLSDWRADWRGRRWDLRRVDLEIVDLEIEDAIWTLTPPAGSERHPCAPRRSPA